MWKYNNTDIPTFYNRDRTSRNIIPSGYLVCGRCRWMLFTWNTPDRRVNIWFTQKVTLIMQKICENDKLNMTEKLDTMHTETRSSICIFVSPYPAIIEFQYNSLNWPFHLAFCLFFFCTSCKFFKSDKKQMNRLSLIRLAIIQQGRVQKSCLNRWLSLWFGVKFMRFSHLAISWTTM